MSSVKDELKKEGLYDFTLHFAAAMEHVVRVLKMRKGLVEYTGKQSALEVVQLEVRVGCCYQHCVALLTSNATHVTAPLLKPEGLGSGAAAKRKRDGDTPHPWKTVGVSHHADLILRRVCVAISENETYGDRYADTSATRLMLDRAIDVYKAGHMRNAEAISAHSDTKDEWDKLIFIFNADGACLGQPWHVDASVDIASSFGLFGTRGFGTDLLPVVQDNTVEYALCLIGIGPTYHDLAKKWARDCAPKESALHLLDILQDIAPLLSTDFDTIVGMSATNGIEQEPGWQATTRGPVPHRGSGSATGAFRMVLLSTSVGNYRGRRGGAGAHGYNTTVQHHRSQVCLYWCRFVEAIRWIWADRMESYNADTHWAATHFKTAKVIRDFLTSAHAWGELGAVVEVLWARALARAYMEDEKCDWPAWVSNAIREPLSAVESVRLAEQTTAGRAARATSHHR